MTSSLSHQPSPNINSSQSFLFQEYQRPQHQSDEEEPSDDSPDSKKTPPSEPGNKPTRAWKVVDARAILTKRKYVKRQKNKPNSIGKSSDTVLTLERKSQTQTPPSEPHSPERTTRSLSWPSPESDVRSGGLRGDPFSAFTENGTSVQGAIDWLVKEIGAVAVPGTIHLNGFSPKASTFIHLGFEHDLVFHAVVAFAQGYKEVATTGTSEPSPLVLYHRGKATQGLLARLQDPATCADDATILTTFLLMDNVWRYGENSIGRAHYAGLQKMLDIRRGTDNLGTNGVLKSMIEFSEVTDLGDSMRTGQPTAPLPDLRYFRHPFPTSVCSLIARLPDAYGEIAMQGHLSVETIGIIISLKEWLEADPQHRSASPHLQIGAARRCMAASKPPDGGQTEEFICFGLVITGMRSFHARFSRMDHSLLDRIVELGEQFDQIRSPRIKKIAEQEHIGYLTMVAVEASDKCIELQGHVERLVDLLVQREIFARSWEGMERVMKRFFWIEFAATNWKACWQKHLKRRAEAQAIRTLRTSRWTNSAANWDSAEMPAK